MDTGIRSHLATGFAVVGVGALVLAPGLGGQVSQSAAPAEAPPAVALTAASLPLPQLAPLSPVNPIVQQVAFNAAFVTDFLSTGAVLFAREFAIPGALVQDIRNGTPVPTAVGHALNSFARVELEAGGQLVRFALEYVGFQVHFLTSLVTMPFAAISPAAASVRAPIVAAPLNAINSGQPKTLATEAPKHASVTGTTAKHDRRDATRKAASEAGNKHASPHGQGGKPKHGGGHGD